MDFLSIMPATKHIFTNQKVRDEFVTADIHGSVIFSNVLDNRLLDKLGLNYPDQAALLSTLTFLQNKCPGYQSWRNGQNEKFLTNIVWVNAIPDLDDGTSQEQTSHLEKKTKPPCRQGSKVFTDSPESDREFELALEVLCPQGNPQHVLNRNRYFCSTNGCRDTYLLSNRELGTGEESKLGQRRTYYWNIRSKISWFFNYTLPRTLESILGFINFNLKWMALFGLIGAALYPKETMELIMAVQGQLRRFVDRQLQKLVNSNVLTRFQ